jgi:hypothetical protein
MAVEIEPEQELLVEKLLAAFEELEGSGPTALEALGLELAVSLDRHLRLDPRFCPRALPTKETFGIEAHAGFVVVPRVRGIVAGGDTVPPEVAIQLAAQLINACEITGYRKALPTLMVTVEAIRAGRSK